MDELIVLLGENTARNPELDYHRFELVDMDNSEWKANFFKNMICQSYPGLCISLNDSAVLRDGKKNTTKMYIARASPK